MSEQTKAAGGAEALFHEHLDVCRRCAEQCFNLCPAGLFLFQRAGQEAFDEMAKRDGVAATFIARRRNGSF